MIPNAARRAPHQGNQQQAFHHAPNAALLIDFDNVTMGIRSDLGKELKALLNSEVIRGKVAVQRAYADWRRYPQYIVPLAESSIDLIFAPAYGSAKKNATDLRMAIDAIELVFTRPEIGTYILMTGDSDFSSCVLKLKEYGKYVIGVGMRESSSDLLIQNCDEYYSYHALSGLTRTDEVTDSKEDPWVLLRRAAQQMIAGRDVMRTDRLKQVMLDLDPAFDEKKIGYSKFSRFVQEGASKGIIRLRKMENGQHEIELDGAVAPAAATETDSALRPAPRESSSSSSSSRGRGRGRGRDRDDTRREVSRPQPAVIESAAAAEPQADAPAAATPDAATPVSATPTGATATPVAAAVPAVDTRPEAEGDKQMPASDDLQSAYGLLQQALRDLGGTGGKTIRDGDVKRKMLDISPGFDESGLGFPKFTRFLRQAHDVEAIDLQRAGAGNYEVSLGSSSRRFAAAPASTARRSPAAPAGRDRAANTAAAEAPTPPAAPGTPAGTGASGSDTASVAAIVAESSRPAAAVPAAPAGGMGLRGRRSGRGAAPGGPPPLLPGQVVQVARAVATEPGAAAAPETAVASPAQDEQTSKPKARRGRRGRGAAREKDSEQPQGAAASEASSPPTPAPVEEAAAPAATPGEESVAKPARRRRGRGRGAALSDEAPAILPGQLASKPADTVDASETVATDEQAAAVDTAKPAKKSRSRSRARKAPAEAPVEAPLETPAEAAPPAFSAEALSLPTRADSITEYLSNSYKGIGKKTAESLLESFGTDLFQVMEEEPKRVRDLLGDRRAGTLLEQWSVDVARRRPEEAVAAETEAAKDEKPKSRSRRGGRGRGTRKKDESGEG